MINPRRIAWKNIAKIEKYGVVPKGKTFGIKISVVRNFIKYNDVELPKPPSIKVSLKELG